MYNKEEETMYFLDERSESDDDYKEVHATKYFPIVQQGRNAMRLIAGSLLKRTTMIRSKDNGYL